MSKIFHASVALIRIGDCGELSKHKLIFIKRSICEGDPWSGHCALPGGGFEEFDKDFSKTAIRETYEEIGIKLRPSDFKNYICSLNPKKEFNKKRLNLHCFEFETSNAPRFFDVSEVSDIFSVRLGDFYDIKNYKFLDILSNGKENICFVFKDSYIIWGLTLSLVLEYIYKINPSEAMNLSFFKQYQETKNSYLEVSISENISIK